jgi:hypothetical protein
MAPGGEHGQIDKGREVELYADICLARPYPSLERDVTSWLPRWIRLTPRLEQEWKCSPNGANNKAWVKVGIRMRGATWRLFHIRAP